MVEQLPASMVNEYQEFFKNFDALNKDYKNRLISSEIKFVVYTGGRILYAGRDPKRAMRVYELSKDGGFMFQKTDKGEWI